MSLGRSKREREVKFAILTEKDFERVLARLGPGIRRVVQVNLYLDTSRHELAAGGRMLRARVTSAGDCLLTFKEMVRFDGGEMEAREEEVPCDRGVLEKAIEVGLRNADLCKLLPEDVLSALPADALMVRAWAKTERFVRKMDADVKVYLDRTAYPGGVEDFELEVECDDVSRARAVAEELVGAAGVALLPQTRTKNQRAIMAARGGGGRLSMRQLLEALD